jgi:hypothetical protein
MTGCGTCFYSDYRCAQKGRCLRSYPIVGPDNDYLNNTSFWKISDTFKEEIEMDDKVTEAISQLHSLIYNTQSILSKEDRAKYKEALATVEESLCQCQPKALV